MIGSYHSPECLHISESATNSKLKGAHYKKRPRTPEKDLVGGELEGENVRGFRAGTLIPSGNGNFLGWADFRFTTWMSVRPLAFTA